MCGRGVLAALLSAGGALAQDWTLVWSDEFDGPGIDPAKWEHEVNGWGGGNNELQYYTARAANSFVADGHLVIQANKEDYTGPDGTRRYTSARLRTANKGDWTYGRFEIRAKLPQGQGLWPAVWMLPTDWVYGGWAASGEIDIMELVGHHPDRVHGTLHFGGEWPANTSSGGSYTNPSTTYASEFHTFVMEWEPTRFRWYVDGLHYHTETSWHSSAARYPAPFNQRFHLLLNVAVGGDWPGSPDSNTVFPQRMEIDYVRVYAQATDLGPPTLIEPAGTSRIEAEDYGTGGQGVGYHDQDAGNNGNAYRSDDVDIEATSDSGGGYNVGWVQDGEWLAYPVSVQTTGLYRVAIRVASPGGSALHLEWDGENLTDTLGVPATGEWQSWRTVVRTNLLLTAGEHVLRLVTEASEFNLNWIEFTAPPPGQDADGDGMTDAWEQHHFHHPTQAAPERDADADGASNHEEFIADTDPTNAVSRLTISHVGRGAEVQISTWPASRDREYVLQMNAELTDPGQWSDLESGVVPTGDVLTLIHSNASGPRAWYRVGVSLPPVP